ncbi:nicotinamide-nucleotide amidase [Pullulanibacillus pueri]|uniref:Putative competence-damage inducible protein n=1 Tax=Pullulanibacillus pueri TaxID=1437324 RepID=A0A8J2ZVP9_9BACL|nr:competence/damage-inducible protein A [Pullulanibacillus pueri]MBM7682544.1 nicotinamide-nucleotide amidase [Pullulanibacillus pueri]GGH81981.1 putative competence-damage inducible protein [Pullulanibacillus pueri]
MNAEIIAVGSELLLGQIANTNAQFISEQLAELGINVFFHTVVGDNPKRLEQVIHIAQTRSNLIIFTGGLGPTKDDLTKEVVAKCLGRALVTDKTAMDQIEAYFIKQGRVMTENNRRQAIILEGSHVLPNNNGMAPGMIIENPEHRYILMPGPPSEMRPMFLNSVKPYLMNDLNEPLHSRVLRFFGIGESALETELMDLIDSQTNPTLAPLAKEGEVTLRLTAKHKDAAVAQELLNDLEQKIQSRVGQFLYGYGDATSLPKVVFELLKEKHLTVAAAESLTGGLFSQQLTDLPGASSVFKGAVVSYTNQVKGHLLEVAQTTLDNAGAVSRACAEEMAIGAKKQCGSDIGISFTGVAGPSTEEGQPIGTVFIGIADDNETVVHALELNGSRAAIRKRTVLHGFDFLRRHLID